jgi:hypothetical protein
LLVLTSAGEQALAELDHLRKAHGERILYWILFRKFYHHDLFFDWKASDLDRLTSLLSEEVRIGKLRFPYRFGRLLYDRFNDTYSGSRTDHLTYQETRDLLEGTPQGVYQIAELLIGPLGALSSFEARYKPCVSSLSLWHCSDTGCQALHDVGCEDPKSDIFRADREVSQWFSDTHGRASEWSRPLVWLHREPSWAYGRPFVDLPEVLAECVLGNERTSLLVSALQGPDKDHLRATIGATKKKREAEGQAKEVASRLTPEEQLQLLLVLRDRTLIDMIDRAASERSILIPVGEVRSATQRFRLSDRDAHSQLSQLGIRAVRENPAVRLISCVWDAYEQAGLSTELEWRIRGDSSRSLRDSLTEYVRHEGPGQAVRQLVLASNLITTRVCESISLSLAQVLGSEDKAVDRLLWKVGFNPEQYDDSIARFSNRLREFRETVLCYSPIDGEESREKIRSVGVNLFVSAEDFVEKLIAYNVWILASDHFLTTHFRFEMDSARCLVSQVLGGKCGEGTEQVSWSTQGQNTLGTLLRYLSEAAKWVTSLSSTDRDRLVRVSDDLPFYALDSDRLFPFRHTEMWADTDVSELRKFSDGFSAIAKLLQQADLAGIRNGLDHHRSEFTFPTSEAMLASAARLQEALDRADTGRYVPKLFWLHGRKATRFGIVEYEFRDHAQRVFVTYGPALVSGLLRIRYERPVLIAATNLLGHPNSQLMFQPNDNSAFSTYWEAYPRRRRIDPDEAALRASEAPSTIAPTLAPDEVSDSAGVDS